MHFLHKFIPLLVAVAALEVQLVWRHEKDTSKTSLSAYSSIDGSLVAETCGSKLVDIDFSHVDDNGVGNFTVGDETYRVHSKAEYSGGPVCSKKFNPEFALVRCSGVEWTAEQAVRGDATSCFDNEHSQRALQAVQEREQGNAMRHGRRNKRAGWYITPVPRLLLVGDGDPHQNYLHKQLSETISCGNADSCTVGRSDSESFAIGFSLNTVGSADMGMWISGGFSVTETWTTGNSYTCSAGTGESVCIWYNTAHTAYTVQLTSPERPGGNTDPYVISSPNANNQGGSYYCVVGTCGSKGDEWWDRNGRPGGP